MSGIVSTLTSSQISAMQEQAQTIANAATPKISQGTFVFFAAFDGTNNGNDPTTDGSGDTQTTAVRQLFLQVTLDGDIGGNYYPGVGTPGTLPGSSGWPAAVTAQSILTAQNAYNDFATQAAAWLVDNPGGSLTSMITSFSRGGAAAAIFAQMLYEKGLVTQGNPPTVLIPPGQVGAVSAALIIDPVLTGEMGNMDFPNTVQNLTVVQAQNEYRTLFTAANYNDPNVTTIQVLGDHGDAGDLYDNTQTGSSGTLPVTTSPLGGIYLAGYTQFFSNAGLGANIAAVPASRAYNPLSSDPVVTHSETIASPGQTLPLWDITYNSSNDPTIPRRSSNVGTPVTNGSFTAYDGSIVLSGQGTSATVNSNIAYVQPGAQVQITGAGDAIQVGDGATLTFTSNAQVGTDSGGGLVDSSNTPVSYGGSATTIKLGDNVTLNVTGANVSITQGKDDRVTVNGVNDAVTLNTSNSAGGIETFGGTGELLNFSGDGQDYNVTTIAANGAIGTQYQNADGSNGSSGVYVNGSGTSITIAADGTKTTTYDQAGGVVSETSIYKTDDSSSVTYFNADGSINNEHTVNADGTADNIVYYQDGNINAQTVWNADGSRVITSYADNGPMTSQAVDNPDGTAKTTSYSSNGRTSEVSITSADGATNATSYNADGSLAEGWITNADGSSSRTEYLDDGNNSVANVLITNADGSNTETFYFNSSGEPTVSTLTAVSVPAVNQQTDNGATVTTSYYANGSPSKKVITDSSGAVINTTAYYANGTESLFSYTIANGDARIFNYYANGQESSLVITSGSSVTTESYDANGMLSGYTAIDTATGQSTTDSDFVNGMVEQVSSDLPGAAPIITTYYQNGTPKSYINGALFIEDTYYANGIISSAADSGADQGSTQYYSQTGQETSDTWYRVDGSHGSDTYNADGSSSGITYNANGSYNSYTDDVSGDLVTTNYDANGNITDPVAVSSSGTIAANSLNAVLTGSSDLSVTGNSLNDLITGNAGNDTLIAGSGNDTLTSGSGNDTLIGSSGQTTYVYKGVGNTTVLQSVSGDRLRFGAGIGVADIIASSATTNGTAVATLNVNGGGSVTIDGGALSQVNFTDGTNVTLGQLLSASFSVGSTSYSTVNATAGAGIVALHMTGRADVTATANALNDVLSANSGNDTLIAGTGSDTLIGGAGNTTYVINADSGNASITQSGSNDTLEFGAGISAGDIYTSVNQNDNSLTLQLSNGPAVVIDSPQFTAVGFADGTTTTLAALLAQSIFITSAVSIVMPTGATSLTLTGSGNISGTGNTRNDIITGNAGNDTLYAGSGYDTLIAGTGNDTLYDNQNGTSTYLINANSGNVNIWGSSSNATLVFGAGITASDISASYNGSVLTLQIAGGNTVLLHNPILGSIDFADGSSTTLAALLTVTSAVSTVLPSGMLNLTLTGTGNISGQGNNFNDIITANSGNDTLIAGSGNDTLIAGTGNDTLVGNGEATQYLLGPNSGTVTINNAGTGDTLHFTSGITAGDLSATAVAVPKSGNLNTVTIHDSQGGTIVINNYQSGMVDHISFADGSSTTLAALLTTATVTASGVIDLSLIGNANLTLTGNASANVLTGNSGNDTLVAGAGPATLIGGTGNDTFIINNAADVITATPNVGHNVEQTSVSATLAANVQTLIGIGSADLTLTGNNLDNTIEANAGNDSLMAGSGNDKLIAGTGNDTLISGTGVDTLIGGTGNDTFQINNTADVVKANASAQSNTVLASVSYTSSGNIQVLTGIGNADLTLTGNGKDNIITGNAGNDTLIGVGGSDFLIAGSGLATLIGGTGNDTYLINNINDVIIEQASQGNDSVLTTVSYVLPANVQTIVDIGDADISLTGNNLNNTITASSGNDTLIAGTGNATLISGSGTDTLIGGIGKNTYVINNSSDVIQANASAKNNIVQTSVNYVTPANIQAITGIRSADISLTGNSLNDTLTANSGNDTLIAGTGDATLVSGSGIDTLIGGIGSNLYKINNSSDVIIAQASAISNNVWASVNYVTPADLQAALTGMGSANISLTGNNLNTTITGNNGNDTLIAGTGDATLVAGNGIDTLIGGIGNNLYKINNTNDVIVAQAGALSNNVWASINYVTPADLQAALTGSGNANISLTGNNLDTTLTANAGNDTLISGTGIDTLVGGTGKDTFIVNNSADLILAGTGSSTVQTTVSYTLTGNLQSLTGTGSAAIVLTGNAQDDKLTANSGDDTLTSGSGTDTLIGGAGNDTFNVNNASDVVNATAGSNLNIINASVSYKAADNVQDLFLTGNAALTGTGNSGNDLIVGNSGADTLTGGSGTDVLEAGAASTAATTLKDTAGSGALIAGAGSNTLTVGANASFIAAGTGSNAINLGAGTTVVAVNSGDGATTISAGSGTANVLSLGGGIDYSDLSFSKSGNNLILNVTEGTSSKTILFSNWYKTTNNQNFVTLQILEQATTTYNPASSNALYNQKVEDFSFTQLVGEFNAALTANPGVSSWSFTNALLDAHLSSSNSAALGGDLAYYDGINGNLTGMNLATAVSTLQNTAFGKTAQTVDAWNAVSGGSNKLK